MDRIEGHGGSRPLCYSFLVLLGCAVKLRRKNSTFYSASSRSSYSVEPIFFKRIAFHQWIEVNVGSDLADKSAPDKRAPKLQP